MSRKVKKNILILSCFMFVVVVFLYGVSKQAEITQTTKPSKEDISRVVNGSNGFALDLYAKLKNHPEVIENGGNLFLSPYSISTALSMTWAGSRGDTEKKMAGVLHFPFEQQKQHYVFGELEKQLNKAGKKGKYQLNVANALWGQQGEPFRKEFTEIVEKNYGAGLHLLDFITDYEKSAEIINRWIEKKTKDKIKKLITPPSIVERATLVLTNAIYFKGDWKYQFDKKKTSKAKFTVDANTQVEVDMMSQKKDFRYGQCDTFQMIELPYKSDELSMFVVLPKKLEYLERVENMFLNTEKLSHWFERLNEQEVLVQLPKFEITWGAFELIDILTKMGLPAKGDFTGISGDRRLFISNVLHKAYIKVDEEGTEATAATAVVMRKTSMGPMFIANRPFVFIIRDNQSGSILFMGRVMNPSK